mmetsp:Transcript_51498/g.117171  ORF Transcript_51498/g.117171 Transcript_51498/m.117171 type:complete len:713 (-) Transcript_51498:350-2488(-)
MLRVDPVYGGVVVAEVQANLGTHGVTVESTPDERFYQNTGELVILGKGFNETHNTLRFANGIRGKGVNYTTVEHTKELLRMKLASGSKWRANPANLPGPLVLLAVDAGGGFVAVGPTEAKKGRTVATIFEDVSVVANPQKVVFSSHSHELWIVGKGFTRGDYKTQLTFDPPIEDRIPNDISILVYNRTHIKLTLFEGEAWLDKKITQPIPLKVMTVNTGPGPVLMNGDGSSKGSTRSVTGAGKGVVVCVMQPDEAQHDNVTVFRSTSQSLYQTALLKDLKITGKGFKDGMTFQFDNGITGTADYRLTIDSPESATLKLRSNKKWRAEGGGLRVLSLKLPGEEAIVVGSGGEGVAVAEILDDPFITTGERIIFATHTKQLIINGYGFVLDDTRITLSPTLPDAYYLDSVEPYRIILRLRDGFSWDDDVFEKGSHEDIYVTKIDTRAGEVVFDGGKGIAVAKVEADLDDNNCDDSCEYAFDGLCDDGTSKERDWYDDDYGGFYGYDDGQYYDYGYYYYGDDTYGDDTFLAAICDVGTDCTDCGGPQHPSESKAVDCDNSCQWANDGFCDDDRTSGLCSPGTDCHDCGPRGAGNFTSLFGDDWEWNTDGDTFWDDDDNYWDIDDTFEYADARGEGKGKKGDSGGGGGIFIAVLEGMVYLVGAVLCGGGTYFAVQFYKGNHAAIPYVLAPTHDPDLEMSSRGGRAAVPITPDNFIS